MPDFVEIIDDALPPELCGELIDAFERSPHRVPGRAGGGVDIRKKVSTDLHLTQHPQYHDLMQRVTQATSLQLAAYFRKYHFALIAPLALTLADPATGEPVQLTHENFDAVGAERVPELFDALYRIGPVQAQRR